MTPISPDLVIDAIARHFPDGFDYPDASDDWPLVIKRDIGIVGPEDHGFYIAIRRVIDELYDAGRLRLIRNDMALSYSEQARRIALALGINNAFDERCETIANVLAGKTEKRA